MIYVIAVTSIITLFFSFYKDRTVEVNTRQVRFALGFHHVAQGVLVILALLAAVESAQVEEKLRHEEAKHRAEIKTLLASSNAAQVELKAQLATAAAALALFQETSLVAEAKRAAGRHIGTIKSTFSDELLPSAPLIVRYGSQLSALQDRMAELGKDPKFFKPFDPAGEHAHAEGLQALKKLRTIAANVLVEKELYGQKYPSALADWASYTVGLGDRDLSRVLDDSPSRKHYLDLTNAATNGGSLQ